MSSPKILVATGFLWLALLWLCPAASQAHVFYQGGIEAFRDYGFPQICAASANVYEFVALCPLQLPILHGGANMLLSNMAVPSNRTGEDTGCCWLLAVGA